MIRRKSQKMVILILAGVLIVSISWSSVGFDSIKSMENGNISDVHAQELLFLQGKTESRSFQVTLKSHIQDQVLLNRDDYELGELIWIYNIPPATFNGAQAIIALPDINEDGIDEVVVCSEDDNIYCLDGASLGSATVLWTHEIYAGDVYNQNDIDLIEDVDDDGYQDIVVGATGGARLIRCISGESGTQIWEHDTHEYGGGGWVYQVNCSYDYDGDGVTDVLATTGDDSGNTGPKRVYCLDGETGVSIWERPLNGPGFSVIGVEDFTGDGQADVLAGSSNEGENEGYAKGINGATGIQVWSFTVAGSSVWALAQINDITNDGIKDVIIGDFSGHIYGLDATDGGEEFSTSLGTAIITRFAKLDDVNGDDHPDIIPAHSTIDVTQVVSGLNGNIIWSKAVADQPWNVARISDISGDAINDVLVGTLFQTNYCYFLDGVDGTELFSINYGEPVDAIAAVSDAIGDGSMEMIAGGRNGKVTCYSGGLDSSTTPIKITANFTAEPLYGAKPLSVDFTDTSTAENTTITSWQWDFNNDGQIDSIEQNPSWIYTDDGSYTVVLTVSDGIRSDTEIKEDYITVAPTSMEIRPISGGLFTVKTAIKNSGDAPLENIDWTIELSGGSILLGKLSSGNIGSLAADETVDIKSSIILGLGKTTVIVNAETTTGITATRSKSATILLFYIYMPPGGGQ